MFQLQIASRSSRSIVSLRSLYFDRPRRLSESSTEGLNFGAFAISIASAPAISTDMEKMRTAMHTSGRFSASRPGLHPMCGHRPWLGSE